MAINEFELEVHETGSSLVELSRDLDLGLRDISGRGNTNGLLPFDLSVDGKISWVFGYRFFIDNAIRFLNMFRGIEGRLASAMGYRGQLFNYNVCRQLRPTLSEATAMTAHGALAKTVDHIVRHTLKHVTDEVLRDQQCDEFDDDWDVRCFDEFWETVERISYFDYVELDKLLARLEQERPTLLALAIDTSEKPVVKTITNPALDSELNELVVNAADTGGIAPRVLVDLLPVSAKSVQRLAKRLNVIFSGKGKAKLYPVREAIRIAQRVADTQTGKHRNQALNAIEELSVSRHNPNSGQNVDT